MNIIQDTKHVKYLIKRQDKQILKRKLSLFTIEYNLQLMQRLSMPLKHDLHDLTGLPICK